MARKKNQLVKREDTASLSNILNEMFFDKLITLQELRFFLVYVSKLNPKKPDRTEVSFTLKEYSQVLGVELNEASMDRATDELMRRIVHVRPKVLAEDVAEEIIKTQLFRRCRMTRRKSDNEWIFTFDASEDVKPHLFDLKAEYTSFEIWNIINLGNVQDARMYMLMRQYRTIGERTIDLKELKKMLNIDPAAYPEYKIFSRDVLKKCQKALKQYTDICFDFNAVGRPAKAVHFTIYENKDYKLPTFLEDAEELEGQQALPDVVDAVDDEDAYIPLPKEEYLTDPREKNYKSEHLRFLAGAVDYEYPERDIQVLMDLLLQRGLYDEHERYNYLRSKYNYMNFRATKKDIPSRFGYLKGAVANNWG